jgi:hypothetical protein
MKANEAVSFMENLEVDFEVNRVEPKKTFKKLDVRQPNVGDIVQARAVAGTRDADDERYIAALMALCCKFDGEKKTMEDVLEFNQITFLKIAKAFSGR